MVWQDGPGRVRWQPLTLPTRLTPTLTSTLGEFGLWCLGLRLLVQYLNIVGRVARGQVRDVMAGYVGMVVVWVSPA